MTFCWKKPASVTVQECIDIAKTAYEYGRKVAVCHVLRYTMFYQLIKFYLDSGRIGNLASVNHSENVGWWHQAQSFVRGHWRNSVENCPMILAKSRHDIDIIRWLVGIGDCTKDFSGHGGDDNRMLEEFLTYVHGRFDERCANHDRHVDRKPSNGFDG